MLRWPLAHIGPPPVPEDIWTTWNLDPVIAGSLIAAGAIYWRGWNRLHRRDPRGWRRWGFTTGLLALAIALLSPLEPLSGALASAHMSQHVLLVVLAPALMAASRPLHALAHGAPGIFGDALRKGFPGIGQVLRALRHPVAAWMLHAGAMWFWHARIPYEAALRSEAIHVLQHASYFLTGLLFWSVVVRTARSEATGWGLGLLMIFAMTSQTTILAALMTFARTPWYRPYAETTGTWGIGQLADQQLAAVIMWIPSGMLYLAAGIGLMATWMRNAAAEQKGSNRVAGPT